MSNINAGQIFNNFPNNIKQIQTGNIKGDIISESSIIKEQEITANIKRNFPNTTMQLSQTMAELSLLNRTQTINMLKELLNFPKSMEQLISQLAIKEGDTNAKVLTLISLSNIDLSELKTLIQSSAKEGITKLYKMVAEYNAIGIRIKEEQINEITKLITYISSVSNSEIQSIKTAITMYLPWLPLTDPEAFKLEITEKGGEKERENIDTITVLISTINYGNVQFKIYEIERNKILIDMSVSEKFPQKELISKIKEENKKNNVNIEAEIRVKRIENKDKNKERETKVYMNINKGIKANILVITTNIINKIHIIDKKEELRERREEKI